MRATKLSESGRRDLVVGQLLGFIRSRELQPGSRLPAEPALSEMFGVSRTVVREAMQTLQATGTIRIEQGRGSFVSDFPLAQPFNVWASMNVHRASELFEVRMILEGEAARRAALGRTQVQIEEIDQSLEEARICLARQDWIGSMQADVRFHRAVTSAAGLPLLQEMLEVAIPVWVNLTSEVARERNQDQRLRAVLAEHEAIASALRDRDADRASESMRRHLGNSRDRRIQNDKSNA
jgi:GntR family transcriptional repressor for pyruvate dehydrogenase complex